MKTSLFLSSIVSLAVSAAAWAENPVLEIDLSAPTKPVSPTFHGLMTEEINFSYDGGLYAELIRNRAFLDKEGTPEHWSLIEAPGAKAEMKVIDTHPLTDKLPNSLELTIASASPGQRVALANEGYWGIPVRPNTAYQATFYVRGAVTEMNKAGKVMQERFSSPLHVSLESADGGKVLAQAETAPVNAHWQKFEVTLKTGADVTPSAANKFVISAENPGTLWLSLVSLFPPTYKDRANGTRIDIMEKLAAMKPKFLRFPGGNYVEGDTLWERFDWKAMHGPLPFRPGHRSCWNYRSTDGMGLLEFMGWCEDLNMKPVLAVYAGYSLRHQAVEAGPLLEPYVQDALDEIEYLTADAKTSYWGSLRAKDGHPAPFTLKYIEIGNEDQFDHTYSYDARFTQFYDAIKAKHPELQLIATAPIKSRQPDVIDDHFYRSAEGFIKDIHHYDNHDRKGPKIFVGEWASREGSPTTNLNAAIGDAAWMTGMERNADLIVLHSYAPLFVNVNPGGMQWKSNLIGYDALNSYGSPSYYAQVMFNNNIGDSIPKMELKAAPEVRLPYSATVDSKTHTLFVKLVNPGAAEQTVRIDTKGASNIAAQGEAIKLSGGNPEDTNSITEPNKIAPVTCQVQGISASFPFTLKPYSVVVLRMHAE